MKLFMVTMHTIYGTEYVLVGAVDEAGAKGVIGSRAMVKSQEVMKECGDQDWAREQHAETLRYISEIKAVEISVAAGELWRHTYFID